MLFHLPGSLPEALRVIGCVQRMLSDLMHRTQRLTRAKRVELETHDATMESLRAYLESHSDTRRFLAVFMALHPRLGENALISALSPELVITVLEHCVVPAPIKYSMAFFQ